MLDTSGRRSKAALDEGVTLIKPNLDELSEFVGTRLDSDDEQLAACRKLIAAGRAEAVALTLGEDGALLVTATQAWRAAPMKIEVASAVGAGDSFLGGMVAALAAGESMEEPSAWPLPPASAAVMSPAPSSVPAARTLRTCCRR